MNHSKLTIFTLLLSFCLVGCGTVKGIGKDIQSVGGWLTTGSDNVKESVKKNPPGSNMYNE